MPVKSAATSGATKDTSESRLTTVITKIWVRKEGPSELTNDVVSDARSNP